MVHICLGFSVATSFTAWSRRAKGRKGVLTSLSVGGLSQSEKDVETPFRFDADYGHAVNDVAMRSRGMPDDLTPHYAP